MKLIKKIAIALTIIAASLAACQEKNDPEEVEVKVEADMNAEKDSVATDPTEGKAEGDLGEGMAPGTR